MFSSFSDLAKRADRYGTTVNSYDWLKFVALVIMTIDHIGAYLMVEPEWWKAIGRITFPVWFFLAGYSQSRILYGEIVWLGIALAIVNYFAGYGIFPLNALVSIVICRYIVLFLRDRGLTEKRLLDISLLCLVFSLPTTLLFEYGTLGIGFAIMGDLVRREKHGINLILFSVFCTALFISYQFLWFSFNIPQNMFMIAGTCYTVWALYSFRIKEARWLPQKGLWNYLIRLISRNTMHYYFFHRVILQLIGLLIGIIAFDPLKIMS